MRSVTRIVALFCWVVLVPGVILVRGMPTAAAQSALAGGATLSGRVVNGTHGSSPVAGTQVVLQTYVSHATAQDSGTAQTDAQGRFAFSGLDGSGATTFVVYTHFQGGTYASDAITFTNGATPAVTLTVYDATSSDASVRVALTTLLVGVPDQRRGTIPIGEFVTFENTGTSAFVPTMAPAPASASSGPPMGLLRFWLPAGATNLSLGAGFSSAQALQVNTGFASTATVPPGKSQFAFAFDLPYTGTQYMLDQKTEYPTAQVAVLVPVGTGTAGTDFVAQPSVTALGQRYDLYTRDNVAASVHLRLRLLRLPLPGERPDLDFGQLLALGGALVLLLALLLALYLRRGDLAAVFGLATAQPMPAPSSDAHGSTAAERAAERKRLLKALLALEHAHAAGAVSAMDFQTRAGRIRERLRTLLAQDVPEQDNRAGLAAAEDNTAQPGDKPPAKRAAAQVELDARQAAKGGAR